MRISERARGGGTTLFFAFLYFAVGQVLGSIANAAETEEIRIDVRLTAFFVSAVAYATHIALEVFLLRNATRKAAIQVSLAVAAGAFALAGAANISPPLHGPSHHLKLALVAWPVLAGIPSFAGAFIIAAFLAKHRKKI